MGVYDHSIDALDRAALEPRGLEHLQQSYGSPGSTLLAVPCNQFPRVDDSPDPRSLAIPGGPLVPARELRWRSSASGGPGGQHANTANTRVELVFDTGTSRALSDDEKARIEQKLGRVVRVVASDERSQWRNRRLALERMGDRLADALEIPRERRPTRPSRRELDRRRGDRLADQRRRSSRRWSYDPED
ncbi:MAG: aminoacyl-tRNA hydrolase [Actinomycetota bacterium]|nr:aminoacyl-tRNA hydrolase [Actinomycetota bacterium]